MISNTTEGLFILYSHIILQKMCFPSFKEFYIDLWSFQLPNYCSFRPNFYGKCSHFFKCSLNFKAYALQLELNKVGYTNFVKLRLQNMSSKIERTFEKITKYVFVFILPAPTLTSFYRHFLINPLKTRRGSSVDCRPSTAEASPIGKIHPSSKMAVTFEPLMGF